MSVAAASFLAAYAGFTAAWDVALRDGVVDLKQHANQYYAFEADNQGYPIATIREGIPLSQYSDDTFPPAGMAELPQVVTFLVNARLARTSVDVAAWRSPA